MADGLGYTMQKNYFGLKTVINCYFWSSRSSYKEKIDNFL